MSEVAAKPTLDPKESWIAFQSSQGTQTQGSLLRLTRHLVVFELYSPNVVLQTSEVLSDLRISYLDRTLYSGRGVIRSVVHTGLVAVCEASLDNGWLDVDFVIAEDQGDKLRNEFNGFFQEWQKLYRVRPEYKSVIADLQTFLTDLRLWLEQVELGIRSSPSGDRARLQRSVALELVEPAVTSIQGLFDRYEAVAQSIEPDLLPAHRAFGKRWLHPLLLCSPFVYRTFQKPLGYAGDYEMVNMMFRDPCEGSSLFAQMVNIYALRLPPIVAHRHRIAYLVELLQSEILRAARGGRLARIFDVGCGPAQEVQRFLGQSDLSDRARFTLVDFNEETLNHVRQVLETLNRKHGRRAAFELKRKSIQQMLKEFAKSSSLQNGERFDFAYCAGLFDYLPDRVCRQLIEFFYETLAPGGLLVVTNVDAHPSRGEMECFLEWNLVYRDSRAVAALVPSHIRQEDVSIKNDLTGINVFLELRKPENA